MYILNLPNNCKFSYDELISSQKKCCHCVDHSLQKKERKDKNWTYRTHVEYTSQHIVKFLAKVKSRRSTELLGDIQNCAAINPEFSMETIPFKNMLISISKWLRGIV